MDPWNKFLVMPTKRNGDLKLYQVLRIKYKVTHVGSGFLPCLCKVQCKFSCIGHSNMALDLRHMLEQVEFV